MIKPHDSKFDDILNNTKIKNVSLNSELISKVKRLYEKKITTSVNLINTNDYNKVMKKFYSDFVHPDLFQEQNNIYHYKTKNINLYLNDNSLLPLIIIKRLSVLQELLNLNTPMNIYLDTNNRKRVLPEFKINETITQASLNKKGEGLTTSGLMNGYIIVSKKEEAVKLVLHEFFHFYDLQPKSFQPFIDLITGKWSIDDSYHLFEAHCELIAIIFHCIFLGIEMNLANKSNIIDISEIVNRYLKKELKYSLLLTARILKFHGYNDCSFFTKGKTVMFNDSIPAYTITRGILFYRLDEYLKLLDSKFSPGKDYYNKVLSLIEADETYCSVLNSLFMIKDDLSIRYIAQDIVPENYGFINDLVSRLKL